MPVAIGIANIWRIYNICTAFPSSFVWTTHHTAFGQLFASFPAPCNQSTFVRKPILHQYASYALPPLLMMYERGNNDNFNPFEAGDSGSAWHVIHLRWLHVHKTKDLRIEWSNFRHQAWDVVDVNHFAMKQKEAEYHHDDPNVHFLHIIEGRFKHIGLMLELTDHRRSDI